MSVLNRIRRAVREGHYVFTDHAVEEAQADNLLLSEIVDILLNGALDSIYEDDLRGVRYVIRGDVGKVEVDVVCRFGSDGLLVIIITVYVVD
ncbi:MAG: DUF4258 domain-containing protein [Chloroflexi bacterium]|nr:DUF4258 domain-containing protein [Chloroflexota bacterium]